MTRKVIFSAVLVVFLIIPEKKVTGQDPFPLTEISMVSESVIKEIRYAGPHNFTGAVVEGYNAPKCYLAPDAAQALAEVQKDVLRDSLSLKLFDCYRPQRAVDHFAEWAAGSPGDSLSRIYFPNVPADELFEQGYIAMRSGHSRGSTVDLTLVSLPYQAPGSYSYPCTDPEGYLMRGSELNMGTAYDCFDVMSHTISERVSEEAMENRKKLLEVMEKHGFVNYSKEWWHFTFKPEAFPDTYFDAVVQ